MVCVTSVSVGIIAHVNKKNDKLDSSNKLQDLFLDEWIDVITFEDYHNIEEYLIRKPVLCYNIDKSSEEMRKYYVELFEFIQEKTK